MRAARISGNAMRRKRSLPHGDAALKKESADLIDDAGALADQPLTHAVQRLQIKLVGILCGDEIHRRTLHRLGNCLGIAEVIFLSSEYGRTYFAGMPGRAGIWGTPDVIGHPEVFSC